MSTPTDPNGNDFQTPRPGVNPGQPAWNAFPPPPPPPGGFHLPPPPPPGAMLPPAPGYRMPQRKSVIWKVVGFLVLFGIIGFNVLIFASMMGGMAMLGGGGGGGLVEYEREEGHSKDKIAVISVDGVIMEESGGGLFSGPSVNPVAMMDQCLDRAGEDPQVKAVILEINSPGGGVTASDLIHHRIMKFKTEAKKPIVVYMKDLAASGGYYISAPADVIVANPTTLTGSIGVIIQGVNFHGTLTEVVKARDMTIKAGKNKDMGSPFADPESVQAQEGRRLLQELVDEMHTRFKKLVKEGRGTRLAADWEDYADGRILSATEAQKKGFVDKLGYFDDAVAEAERLSGATGAQVVEYGRKPSGLAALLGMGAQNAKPTASLENLPEATADALAARLQKTVGFFPNKPLALWVP